MEATFYPSAGKALTISRNRASSSDKTNSRCPKIISYQYHPGRVSSENCCCATRKAKSSRWRLCAADGISSSVDPANAQITWQIVVGAAAGVTPFVVAGIEFGKRIIAQRRCEVCSGSGLVLEEKEYFRCPECGGFLPWQSWKRFFSG